jgi:hypothetical protein
LVEGRLCVLPELVRIVDVEHDLHVVTRREPPRERCDGCGKAKLAENLWFEVVAEGAEVTHGIARECETTREHRVCRLSLAFAKARETGVQHLGDRREVLDRPIVQELRQPAALLLFGKDPFCE